MTLEHNLIQNMAVGRYKNQCTSTKQVNVLNNLLAWSNFLIRLDLHIYSDYSKHFINSPTNAELCFPTFYSKRRVICLYSIIEIRINLRVLSLKGCVFIKMLIWCSSARLQILRYRPSARFVPPLDLYHTLYNNYRFSIRNQNGRKL